jgi:hypothetical protein
VCTAPLGVLSMIALPIDDGLQLAEQGRERVHQELFAL